MERKEFRGATEADRIQIAILHELREIKEILKPSSVELWFTTYSYRFVKSIPFFYELLYITV